MKRNSIERLRIVLLSACFLFVLYESITLHSHWYIYPWDLTYRYNEILCAHTGVDPFDVFERTVESEEFCGIRRPDMPIVPTNGRKEVHTYPVTHMALFWWYGYFPLSVCTAILNMLNLCVLVWVFLWASKRYGRPDNKISLVQDILFVLCVMLYPLSCICETLNYGLLLLGAALYLYTALRDRHEILAGLAYAFIMIKPQVGIVLFLPLFFGKWYKTIALAAAICIVETLFVAWKLDKSPIEMILQLPRIGAPFYKGFVSNAALQLIGPVGPYLVMAGFLLIAAVGCFLVRNADDIWVRFLPAIIVIPFWTYSSSHDWLILLPCLIYLFNDRRKYPRLYDICSVLMIMWTLAFFVLRHGKMGWARNTLDTILLLAMLMCIFIPVVLDARDKWRGRSWLQELTFWRKD